MLYDLEIVMPVTLKDKYGKRLEDIKRTGILNIQDKKLLVTLLVGPEKIKQEGWPPGVDIQIIPSENAQETAKTYNYFSHYNTDIEARWTAKFDDDTITDVSGLVDKLDLEYDCDREYYVVTEFRPEQHHYEDDLLKKLGFKRWFNPKNVIWHELEGCVVSRAALRRIIADETAVKLMTERSKTPEGFNDYCLACAARICKIYPSDAYFLSRHPLIGDFSMFGGWLCHIHDLSHDKNEHAFDLFQRMMRKDMGLNKEVYSEIVNKEFVYHNWQGMHIIHLLENGIIEGPGDARVWHVKPNGTLEFLKSDGGLISVFDNYETTNFLAGYSVHPCSRDFKPSLRKLAG